MDPAANLRAHLQLDEQVRLQLPPLVQQRLLAALAPSGSVGSLDTPQRAPMPLAAVLHLPLPKEGEDAQEPGVPTARAGAVPLELVAPSVIEATTILTAGRFRQVGPSPPAWSAHSNSALEAQLAALRSAAVAKTPTPPPASPVVGTGLSTHAPLPPISHHGLQRTAEEAPMAPPLAPTQPHWR